MSTACAQTKQRTWTLTYDIPDGQSEIRAPRSDLGAINKYPWRGTPARHLMVDYVEWICATYDPKQCLQAMVKLVEIQGCEWTPDCPGVVRKEMASHAPCEEVDFDKLPFGPDTEITKSDWKILPGFGIPDAQSSTGVTNPPEIGEKHQSGTDPIRS